MPVFWPTQLDYQDALASPALCFADGELAVSEPVDQTPFGTPSPIAGQFANVYRLRHPDGRQFAARLFLRAETDRTDRWRTLATHLAGHPATLAYFVPFAYQTHGILVRGDWFPLIKMPWEPGLLLNETVSKRLYEAEYLNGLAMQWQSLAGTLADVQFAHGDLQHGNILVSETGALRLIDLDGAWVPALAGRGAREAGHPAYQHPFRAASDWGAEIDRFAALVVYVALRALAVAPQAWYRLDNGDNLLFNPADFANPEQSRAFAVLKDALRTFPEEKQLVSVLRAACTMPVDSVPTLESLRA